MADVIEHVVAMVLAPPQPLPGGPYPCHEPESGHERCDLACAECGWHRPYCCCV